jgi:hypothetical protein
MATAPRLLTLRKEDYRDAPSWLGKLFQQLNEQFSATGIALTRGLTRSENLRSTVKVITFTTLAVPADTFPLPVKHDLGKRPTDVWVGRLRVVSGSAGSSAWSMTWELDTLGNLSVSFQGLAASTTYEARLLLE